MASTTCSLKWLDELQHEVLVSWLFVSLWESLSIKKKTTSAKQRVKIFKLDSAFAPLSLINLFTRGCKGPWNGQCEQGEPVKINIVKKLIYPYVSNMSRNLTTKVNYEFSFDNDSQRPLRVNKKNHHLPELLEQVSQLIFPL